MIAFADSSALVKLYIDEEGHEAVRALSGFVVSALARVEVPAALWRKHRAGDLSLDEAASLIRSIEHQFSTEFVAIPAGPAVLEHAARLVAPHHLRGYDAVQLASALAARSADPACDHFACFDGSLRNAAVIEGLRLVPPSFPGG